MEHGGLKVEDKATIHMTSAIRNKNERYNGDKHARDVEGMDVDIAFSQAEDDILTPTPVPAAPFPTPFPVTLPLECIFMFVSMVVMGDRRDKMRLERGSFRTDVHADEDDADECSTRPCVSLLFRQSSSPCVFVSVCMS